MTSISLVALGGAIGSVLRFLLIHSIHQNITHWKFPLGTFIVNIVGCFAIGTFAALALRTNVVSPELRLFLFTGLAGGFTTFSAFGLETFELLRKAHYFTAGSYVASSIVLGLCALWLGFSIFAPRAIS